MPDYEQAAIVAAFEASDVADTTTARGRILEDLIVLLFSQVEGVRHFSNNQLNAAGSTELDVCFWNAKRADGFPFLENILVAECKNTAARIGSAEIRNFRAKLEDMKINFGILVATHGITGDAENLRNAHDAVRQAFQHGIQIAVLTKNELLALTHTDDLVRLIEDKILMLTVQTQTFVA